MTLSQAVHSESLGTQGPHLVMLHGWGRSKQALKPLAELLARDYRVHLVDLPGFGQSPKPQEVWGAKDYAVTILETLSSQKIQSFQLLGHSFGGKVSACMAAQAPERVERLVLVASSGLHRKRSLVQRLRSQGIRLFGKLIRRYDQLFSTQIFEQHFSPRFASADYRNAGEMRSILVKAVNEEIADMLPEVQAPTLLLWGEQDQETPLDIAERMQQAIPHSQLLRLPGKGHEPFAGGGAQLCAYHLRPFLAGESLRCSKA